MSKPIYSAIFLTPESRSALLEYFPAIHPNVFAHHVTLMFKPSSAHLDSLDIGRYVAFDVVGYAADDMGQAVAVRLPLDIDCAKSIPHVTISTAPGIGPKYSNSLLAVDIEPVESFHLEGVIGVA